MKYRQRHLQGFGGRPADRVPCEWARDSLNRLRRANHTPVTAK